MSNTDDQLVADYLGRLAAAATSLPADRRDELIEAISAHIAEARALSPESAGQQTPSVAETLARLGQPDDIVRVAAELGDTGQPGGPPDGGLGKGDPGWPAGARGELTTGIAATGPGAGSPAPSGFGPGGSPPGGYGLGGY